MSVTVQYYNYSVCKLLKLMIKILYITRNWPAVIAKPEIITVFAFASCPILVLKKFVPQNNTPLKIINGHKKILPQNIAPR